MVSDVEKFGFSSLLSENYNGLFVTHDAVHKLSFRKSLMPLQHFLKQTFEKQGPILVQKSYPAIFSWRYFQILESNRIWAESHRYHNPKNILWLQWWVFLAVSLLLIAQLDKFHEIEGEPSGVFFWIVFKSKPTNLFFDQTWSVLKIGVTTIVRIRWSSRNLVSPLCFPKIITGCLLSMRPFISFLFVKVSCLFNIFWNNLSKSKVQSKLKKVWVRE